MINILFALILGALILSLSIFVAVVGAQRKRGNVSSKEEKVVQHHIHRPVFSSVFSNAADKREKMVDNLLKHKRLTLEEMQFIYDFLMDTGKEKWRYIEGYSGYYRISTEGFVYSCRRKNLLTPSERTVNPLEGKKAYQVMLSVNGEAKGGSVHKLVAQTFIPNPSGAVTVVPKDGDYRHCNVRNLMWKPRVVTTKIAAKIETIEAA